MIKAPIDLQELRRRIYRKAKSERVWVDGGGVTNTSTANSGCSGTGKSDRSEAPSRTRESGPNATGTHNPSGEIHWASCMRENRTYSS
jgi:hypothetical protein